MRQIVFVPELPKTVSGKIRRMEVRVRAAAAMNLPLGNTTTVAGWAREFERTFVEYLWAFAGQKAAKFAGITLAHNVREEAQVDAVLKLAERAGGRIEKPAGDTFWGGYSGYFSDPDGYLWEVAWGAFPIREDGSLEIP
jgi:catechol 2,3-dioxygenase-like lactoylglutathione lyase family enzyme